MSISNLSAMETASIRFEKIDCPVCESDKFSFLFKKQGEIFVRCESCTLVLINPRPVFNEVLDTYNNQYSGNYAIKGEKKLRRCRRWVNRVKSKYIDHGNWLDVGCSVGFVVKAAIEAGYEGFGTDVEKWGIKYGRETLQLQNLSQGTLEAQNYPDHFFQVISLYDVIEHVPDLNGLTKELKRILAVNGVIDIITPDVGHWRTPGDLSAWNEIKPSEHLYYFNSKTLSLLLEKHGLQIVKKRIHMKPSLRVYVKHSG
jgi:2-polyprenyl-3-methyl-5-hydroxy-6-metoxy-1,4-benzoquinol methylase